MSARKSLQVATGMNIGMVNQLSSIASFFILALGVLIG